MRPVYPWCAVVGQDRLRLALTLCAIDPSIGGVLIHGPRGVAKTTLARALGELVPGSFVELPLGASEERITGTLDLGTALREQRVELSPGLLARAHEGVLYVDEVNLLADHLVDLLLDAAASGVNVVERDGISHAHAARFVLIGSMNPEEGELRPQLLDRFGLSVSARADYTPDERVEVIERRLAFEAHPERFRAGYTKEQHLWQERCEAARERLARMPFDRGSAVAAAERCARARVDGVRADLAMVRAARAHAAWHARDRVEATDLDSVEELALEHRRPAGPPPDGASGPHGGTPRSGGPSSPSSSAASRATSSASAAGASGARAHSDCDDCEQSDAQSPRAGDSRADTPTHSGPGSGTAFSSSPSSETAGAPGAAEPRAGDAPDSPDPRSNAASNRAGRSAHPSHWSAIPVPVAARPSLRARIQPSALRHSRPEMRRRARARRLLNHGALDRGSHTPTARRTVDWFATFAATPTPRLEDLRYRAQRSAARQLIIIALDCSASMLRAGALAEAKALAHELERAARLAGSHTALISFQGNGARIEAAPKAGLGRLRRRLEDLGAGGGTPLRHALESAVDVASDREWSSSHVAKRLLLLTDGRTRESFADQAARVRSAGLDVLVIDCERSFVRVGRTPALARQLGAQHTSIQALAISGIV